jgi:hypothetical protein
MLASVKVEVESSPKDPTVLELPPKRLLITLAFVGLIASSPVLALPETSDPSLKRLSEVLFAVNAEDLKEFSETVSVLGELPEIVEFLVVKYFAPFSAGIPPPSNLNKQ